MKNKTLNMNLNIRVEVNKSNNDNEYYLDITNVDNNKDNYKFCLSDETTDELKKFIDYLLEKINEYDELKINFKNDDDGSLKNTIGEKFKEIWEKEFKNVKEEINSL